jgi:MFS family permease
LEPRKGNFELIPKAAFRVFHQPGLIKFGILWFVSGILDRFYYIATAPYLTSLGFSPSQIMPIMTLGQFTEAGLLLLTGPALKRLGLRNVLLLGLGMQLLRFVLFWLNLGPAFLLLALASHGFVFAFFFAVGTIFVDGHTQSDTRGGVHQLMSLIFFGSSAVVGALLTGLAFDWFATGGVVDYNLYYLIPIGLAVVNLILAPLFFRRSDTVEGHAQP